MPDRGKGDHSSLDNNVLDGDKNQMLNERLKALFPSKCASTAGGSPLIMRFLQEPLVRDWDEKTDTIFDDNGEVSKTTRYLLIVTASLPVHSTSISTLICKEAKSEQRWHPWQS